MTLSLALLGFSLLSVYICYSVAKSKGASTTLWVMIGLILGPLALPLLFLIKRRNDEPEAGDSDPGN